MIEAIERASREGNDTEVETLSLQATEIGRRAMQEGDYSTPTTYWLEATLWELAKTKEKLGKDKGEIEPLYREASEAFEAAGNSATRPIDKGTFFAGAAKSAAKGEDFGRAKNLYEQAAEHTLPGYYLEQAAMMAQKAGQLTEAIRLYERAAGQKNTDYTGCRAGECYATAAHTARQMGNPEQARSLTLQAIDAYKEHARTPDGLQSGWDLERAALLAHELKLPEAKTLFVEAATAYHTTETLWGNGLSCFRRALELAIANKDAADAIDIARKGEAMAQDAINKDPSSATYHRDNLIEFQRKIEDLQSTLRDGVWY